MFVEVIELDASRHELKGISNELLFGLWLKLRSRTNRKISSTYLYPDVSLVYIKHGSGAEFFAVHG